ncbi:hypothetical protein D9M68_950450 [compost metagenome]
MRKVAHYFYGGGEEVVISCHERQVHIRDQHGNLLLDPCHKKLHPHPAEQEADGGIPSYDEIGLYYGYAMPDTGWDGDC